MQSCVRLVMRRLCLKRGVFSTMLTIFFFVLFCLYFFSYGEDSPMSSNSIRVVNVPTLKNSSPLGSNETHNKIFQNSNAVSNNTILNQGNNINNVSLPRQIGVHVMSSDTPECTFASDQPEGKFNVQMSSLLESLSFKDTNGGVWKQGFDISYNKDSFSGSNKLQVYLMPHSHNDPGWLKTFEDYYNRQTRNILNLMTESLSNDATKKFIWAEISYLDLWWNEQNEMKREQLRKLVLNGQLEIVTGGWVMNDEANTHYFAMLDQLIEGHLWLQEKIPGVIPRSGWAIDPFGYSPTMAYLLKGCGLDAMLIQRAHYSVKKHLARNKQLEFSWEQEWDRSHNTGILCHLMPFYSYDIPHTCGPDPKICCQFDFNRLSGSKVNCPWRIRPQPIGDRNIKERAETLADQYRKKSTLFKTNHLLVPLGDDFRWDTQKEITAQFENYFKLIKYMNSHPEMNIKVQFATLGDYFTALRESLSPGANKGVGIIPPGYPSLAGDFFTYSDRDDHYWSGYYTSRPFHKHMTRVLEYNLRMAEIFFSLSVARGVALDRRSKLNPQELLTKARRDLGLFQHHDGITGTAKNNVVDDYANRLFTSVKNTKDITRASIKSLLSEAYSDIESMSSMSFTQELTYSDAKVLPRRTIVDIRRNGRQIVSFVNSLAHESIQLVSILVNSPNVMVKDFASVTVASQINPVFKDNLILVNQFELMFQANIPALGVVHYLITVGNEKAVRAVVQYINFNPSSQSDLFQTKQFPTDDFILTTSRNISAKFSGHTGLLKTLTVGSNEVRMDLDFVSYGTSSGKEKSGAYLFMPDKEASSIVEKPHVTIVLGPLFQKVTSDLGVVKHSFSLFDSLGLDGQYAAIHNLIDLSPLNNKEIAMRFRSSINNANGTFYTDLNGFQLTRRRTNNKIPMQGNFYPMPTTSLLQDKDSRLTLLTGQPLGTASLKQGWLEVMLDRRLMQDDHRGLGQGIKDNVLTFESFRLLLERRLSDSKSTSSLLYPSLISQHSLDSLLHPPAAFVSPAPLVVPHPYSFMQRQFPCDMFLLNLRSIFHPEDRTESALIIHRRGFDCGFNTNPIMCDVNNGDIHLGDIFNDVTLSEVTETSLSLLKDHSTLQLLSGLLTHLNIMEIKTYRVVW